MKSLSKKKVIPIIFLFVISNSCFVDNYNEIPNKGPNKIVNRAETLLSNDSAIIRTAHGNIRFKFYKDKAPNTIKKIKSLIDNAFYNGIIFHRVIPGTILQTGKNKSRKITGDSIRLKSEINNLQHDYGTISMARYENDPDSANSQFFIALKRLPDLDEKYTIFAQVVDGFDTLNKISEGDVILSITISRNVPTN